MSTFNTEQKAAISYVDGPLLVIAGAGSGKTRVITNKIAYLIEHDFYAPNTIYALTFTNKAAHEMSHRLKSMLVTKAKRTKFNIHTFHALGLIIIKKHTAELGLKPNFSLFDAADSFNLLKSLSGELSAVSDDTLKVIQSRISSWKNNLISAKTAFETCTEQTHLAARFYVHYDQVLRSYNAVDFDDLIGLPITLFKQEPEVLSQWQNKIRYLMVDEYQDTNSAQYQIMCLLTGVRGALTVVGDDDQSIYSWRGAKPENIQTLQTDFPNLKIIKLEQNYRSTSTILQAANHLISHNPHLFEKKLWSTLGSGQKIKVLPCSSESAEIERILIELTAHQFQSRKPFGHYAILYRSNHQAKYIEQGLRERAVPYHISGGTSFFERAEIKDLFAYFRIMVNPDDDTAYLRAVNTPRREIGPSTLEKLGLYAKERNCSLFHASLEYGLTEHLPEVARDRLYQFAQMIIRVEQEAQSDECIAVLKTFIQEIGYDDFLLNTSSHPNVAQKKIEFVKDLLSWLERMITEQQLSFTEAIQKMILLDMIDRGQTQHENHVQLMTLHAAKGLEFDHVFIMGWEEDVLPHKTSIEENTVEEERRLAYVGMTRAKQTLTLTFAKQKKRFGESLSTTPSRFLYELPMECLDWEQEDSALSKEETQSRGQSHLSKLREMLKEPEK